jgi:ATP/maltotriose-dependent transcriptional regulator MalT
MSPGKRRFSGESTGGRAPDRKDARDSKGHGKGGQAARVGDAPVTTILQTKLRSPDELPGLVARPRLVELLEQNARRPLTLVSAPAGYGKTTLVTQWLRATKSKPAWLQLGEDDGDLRTFLSYFVAAVRVQFPEACPDTTK